MSFGYFKNAGDFFCIRFRLALKLYQITLQLLHGLWNLPLDLFRYILLTVADNLVEANLAPLYFGYLNNLVHCAFCLGKILIYLLLDIVYKRASLFLSPTNLQSIESPD